MRLIVVSNRGPVSFTRDANGARVARRGGGGLVTALSGLPAHHDMTWIASAASDEDRAEPVVEFDNYRLHFIAHDPDAYHRFYNEVANPLLWFIHHYLWGLGTKPDVDAHAWAGYEEVNRNFAAAVIEELDRHPDARVFFHDYHLYLAPALVREARPDAVLAHFIHVPWPQSDYWHVLPEEMRRAVFEGLLANDVVALHTQRWRRNFVRSCEDICGGIRRTHVAAHGISIDPAEFDELARAELPTVFEQRPERVILRVDRTDPSKNIVRGFRAMEALLDAHAEHRGRVTMLALLDPSRQDIPEYVEYLADVERTAAAVSARYPGAIDLRVRDNFPQTIAAYLDYDVLFVNAVYDGMNLIAKEAPLVNQRDGAVVLSENTGAHEELASWTLTVNPFDVAGQAEALHAALTMGAGERAERARAICAHVRDHDVARWIGDLLGDLDRVTLPG
ncbi:MAG TPA: trehalose-6-phosphate synthase [Gaiellaceae bacterium]|nr:trehalose-6-phosphate synthase [Gaiellaceae bacterium]